MLRKEFLNTVQEIINSKKEEEEKRYEKIIEHMSLLSKCEKITGDILEKELALKELPTVINEEGYFKEFIKITDQKGTITETEIFYLLKGKQVSCLHTLETTETWTWLGGEEISLFVATEQEFKPIILNKNNSTYIIEKGTLFGAKINNHKNDNDFGLVTCLCKPGFIPKHYSNPTLKELDSLKKKYPEYKSVIDELTPKEFKNPNNMNKATSSDESIYNNSKNNFIRSAFLFCAQCIGIKKNEEQTPLINSPQNNR